ncbi:MAG: hypothetical protein M3O15_06480, partial [Acidobacteriota bacterium]|nr:hypothetical protein [Acidobacteriota bacterium]
MIHALLVSSGRAPDAVAGVSIGAVNAAVLAEVMQAGDAQQQVDKLRKFIDAYLRVPGEIVNSIVPDAFEINARQPLKPIELPIHFAEERTDRQHASRSRWGLSIALNKLVKLGLTVRHLTRVVNTVLKMIAAADLPRFVRYRKSAGHLATLWYLSLSFVALAPLLWRLLFAAAIGANDSQRGSTAGRLLWHPYSAVERLLWASGHALLFVVWLLCGLAPVFFLLSLLLLAISVSCAVASWALLHGQWVRFAWRLHNGAAALGYGVLAFWHRRDVIVYSGLWCLAALFVTLTFFVAPLKRGRRAALRGLLDRVLANLALNDGLANTYALKQQLVACFDRDYYGRIDIDAVLDQAAGKASKPMEANPRRRKKTLGDYRGAKPAIQVGAIAAEVRTGDLSVLDGNTSVVDALLAATAYSPYFPAVEVPSTGLEKRFFIDGGNISREAVGPLLDLLRNEDALDQFSAVDVYPVNHLPADRGAACEEASATLVDVALRALQLQRRRDATIEQRLTKLYSQVLPRGSGRSFLAGRTFVNAEVYPLEVATSSRKAGSGQREALYQKIAGGCRAALEGMIPRAVARAAERHASSPGSVPCREAIGERLDT